MQNADWLIWSCDDIFFHCVQFDKDKTEIVDSSDFVLKACKTFNFHLKFPLNFRPEQHQAIKVLL